VKTLIVGAGRIAGLYEDNPDVLKPCTHAGAFLANDRYTLDAVVDSSAERAAYFAAKFGLARWFSDLSEALDQVRPDLVTVATPYRFHHDIILELANSPNRPKAVFCEKPMADTLERAQSMARACEDKGVVLFVNNRRLTPFYRKLKELLDSGEIGEVIAASAWCSSGLRAVGIHMLDLLRYVFGEASWVNAAAELGEVTSLPHSENYTADDPRVTALIGFKNGLTATFSNTARSDYIYFEIEILCRSGRIRAVDNGGSLQLSRMGTPGKFALSYRLRPPEEIVIPPVSLFARIAECLSADIGRADSHPLSAYNGLETFRLLDALDRSAKAGGQKIELSRPSQTSH